MFLERNVSKKIEQCLEFFPVVVLTGVRQCGKTTLARHIRPHWNYFDLEKGSDYDLVTNDFDLFFNQYDTNVIIDEAQLSPRLFQELRGVVDSDRDKKGRYILTGSSSPDLKTRISESLAGRVAIIETGTLKINERCEKKLPPIYKILTCQAIDKHISLLKDLKDPVKPSIVLKHFLEGGYPETVVNSDNDFRTAWFSQYFETYVQRDIKALFPGLQSTSYRHFIRMLSDLSGTTINRSHIARSLNVSEGTVRNYLETAEGTYVWRNIPSLERTQSRSTVKMGRGYIRDSGLMHYLRQVNSIDRLLSNPKTGHAFEGFIIEEIIQGIKALTLSQWTYNYYRTRGGREVDLVLTSPNGNRIPIEIKFGSSTRSSEIRSLATFIEQEQLEYGIVVNNSTRLSMLTEKIIQVPAGYL